MLFILLKLVSPDHAHHDDKQEYRELSQIKKVEAPLDVRYLLRRRGAINYHFPEFQTQAIANKHPIQHQQYDQCYFNFKPRLQPNALFQYQHGQSAENEYSCTNTNKFAIPRHYGEQTLFPVVTYISQPAKSFKSKIIHSGGACHNSQPAKMQHQQDSKK